MNVSSEDHKIATALADELEVECVRKIEYARRKNWKTAQVLLSAGDGEYLPMPIASLKETFVINWLKEKMNLNAKIEHITDKNVLGGGSDVRVYHKHARWLEITL